MSTGSGSRIAMQFESVGSHDDVVNDIAFDFYGRRFATCSSDKNIRVWDLKAAGKSEAEGDASDSHYSCSEISRAHQSSIWRLSWAHPEFGQLLASCSEDRTTCIWEEQESIGGGGEYIKKNDRAISGKQTTGQRWTLKTTLSESRKSVNDVEFAPRHLGLKIATASADGFVRIYEAPDVFSLNMWQLEQSIEVEQTVPVPLSSQTAAGEAGGGGGASSSKSEHGLTCLTWNVCPFEPAKLAVGGYSSRAVVLTQDTNDNGGPTKWREECVLGEHTGIIHDIAWAPAMGRSYHLIATASREPSFKVHTLQRLENGSLQYTATQTIEAVGHSAIWRVAWNATGTVLATSSEDGIVALWRKDFLGVYKCVQEVSEVKGASGAMVMGSELNAASAPVPAAPAV